MWRSGKIHAIVDSIGGRSGALTKMSEIIDSGSSVASASAIADCGESTSDASSIPSAAAHPMISTKTATVVSTGPAPDPHAEEDRADAEHQHDGHQAEHHGGADRPAM